MFKPRQQRKENHFFRNRKQGVRLPVEVPMSRKELILRRRIAALALLKWSAVSLFAGSIIYYAADLWGNAFRNGGAWTVGEFEYHTNGGIPARLAASTAGLRPDTNLMDVDMGAVRESLEQMPRVKSVKIERRLPDKLSITLDERIPVAWLTSDRQGLRRSRGGLMLDAEGIAFRCDEVLEAYSLLPSIDEPALPQVRVGQKTDHSPVRTALRLLNEMNNVRKWPVPLRITRVNIRNQWTLETESESGASFTFHPDEMNRQLQTLDYILRISMKSGRLVSWVNLQMNRNIPMRFFDQPAEPEASSSAIPVSQAVPSATPPLRKPASRSQRFR